MKSFCFFLVIGLVNVVWCALLSANQTPIHDQLQWMARLKPNLSTQISSIMQEYDVMLAKVRQNAGQYTDLNKMMKADVQNLFVKIVPIIDQVFPDRKSDPVEAMRASLTKSIEVMAVEFQFSTRYKIDAASCLDRQMKVFEVLIDPVRTRFGKGKMLISHLFVRFQYILFALIGYNIIGYGCDLKTSDYISIFESYLYARFGDYLKRIYVDNRKDTYSPYADEYTERTLDTDARRKTVNISDVCGFEASPYSVSVKWPCYYRPLLIIKENKKIFNKHVDLTDNKKTRIAYNVRPYAAIHDMYDDILEFDGFRVLYDVVKGMIDRSRDCAEMKTTWNYMLIGLANLRARLVKINLFLNDYMDQREIEKVKVEKLPDILKEKVSNFHLQLASLAEELIVGSSLRQRLITQLIVSHVPMLLSYHLTVGAERLVLVPESRQDGDEDCKYGIKRLELQNLIFKELQSEHSISFQVNKVRYIQTINIAKTWLLR